MKLTKMQIFRVCTPRHTKTPTQILALLSASILGIVCLSIYLVEGSKLPAWLHALLQVIGTFLLLAATLLALPQFLASFFGRKSQ